MAKQASKAGDRSGVRYHREVPASPLSLRESNVRLLCIPSLGYQPASGRRSGARRQTGLPHTKAPRALKKVALVGRDDQGRSDWKDEEEKKEDRVRGRSSEDVRGGVVGHVACVIRAARSSADVSSAGMPSSPGSLEAQAMPPRAPQQDAIHDAGETASGRRAMAVRELEKPVGKGPPGSSVFATWISCPVRSARSR